MSDVPAILERPRASLVVRFADRYGVEPAKMLETLKATAFKVGRDDPPATNEEMMALLIVAEQYHLNPFTKELYAFRDKQRNGIVPVVSVDGWARIINEHPMMDGVSFRSADDGSAITCLLYRKDRSHPIEVTEYLIECKRGTIPWQSHPRRMLRHKALIQCARLAFGFAGIYDEDEAHRIIHGGTVERTEPPSASAQRVRGLLGSISAEGQQGMRADDDRSASGEPAAPSATLAGGPRSGGVTQGGAAAPATKPAEPPASDDDEAFEPPARSLASYMDEVLHASDAESAGLVLDEARGRLLQPEHSQLAAAYRGKWSDQQPE